MNNGGNESADVSGFGPAGLDNALTVAATDPDDRRFGVSNWGQAVSLAGPGADVLSLRARRTDFVQQVERMLLMSADDVEVPGWDQYTGFGRLNALEALRADPDWFLVAKVAGVEPALVDGRRVIRVTGTARASDFQGYSVELGKGEAPEDWHRVGPEAGEPVEDGVLALIPLGEITSPGRWTVRVVVRDRGGNERQAWGSLDVR